MDDFFVQFIAATWRLIAFIIGLLAIAAFIAMRGRNKKEEKIRQDKQSMNKEPAPGQETADKIVDDFDLEEFPVPQNQGSIFDDEELFPDEDEFVAAPVDFDPDDDPLAELYAARAEAQQTTQVADTTNDDDEEAVDLASLLVGMAADDEPKDYHTIAEEPVGIMLATGKPTVATELLSIMRDERDSRLMIQLRDVAYRTLLNDAAAKATFTKVMKELSEILIQPDDAPPEDIDVSDVQPHTMTTESIDVQVSSGGDTTAREMLSILRDSADEHLIVQIGKKGYRTLVDNPKAKAGFSKVMKELATVILAPDNNPPVVLKPKPQAKPNPTQSETTELDDESEVLPGDIRIKSMDELPTSYVKGRFGQVKIQEIENKVEDLNIAAAINQYLQYKIGQTPEFQGRGIYIKSSLSGGVNINVEGTTYESVDEIEPQDARDFIRQAIDEWQERH